MSKKYKTIPENVIWLMKEKGPITSLQIAESLGKEYEQISGLISNIAFALEEYISKERANCSGRPFSYILNSISVKKGHELFKQHLTNSRMERRPKVKSKRLLTRNRQINKSKSKIRYVENEGMEILPDQIWQYIHIRLQESGINVKVIGPITLTFGIKGGGKMEMEVK